MMARSFLTGLVSLREEDFLTAVLGYLLQEDRQLLQTYLRKLGFKDTARFSVRIQGSFGTNLEDRPDLEISGPGALIFQENKIDSPEGRGQLKRYAKRLIATSVNRKVKRKMLVYMTKNRPELHVRTADYGIPVRFRRWEQVAAMLKSRSHIGAKNKWLRDELYNFLREKEMVAPPSLQLDDRLLRNWKLVEPQRVALDRMIKDVIQTIGDTLNARDYRCRPDGESDGLGFYVKRTKGRMAKVMQNTYVWIWGGISFEDGNLYVHAGFGWVRNHSERIPESVRNFLKSKQFRHYPEEYDEYYNSKTLRQVIGVSKQFESNLGLYQSGL